MSVLYSDVNIYFQTHADFHFYAAIHTPQTVDDSIQATEAKNRSRVLL